MNEHRLAEEGLLLRMRFPDARVGVDADAGTGWCHLPTFPLPSGWSQQTTNLLLVVPAGYPQVPPDSFFIEHGLRDRFGSSPAHYFEFLSAANPYHSQGWAWFCYHVRRGAWAPAAWPADGDSLLTYANLVFHALGGVVTGR